MRKAFEAAAKTYEAVKKSVQEKWEGFMKKFEGTKTELSREIMDAKIFAPHIPKTDDPPDV